MRLPVATLLLSAVLVGSALAAAPFGGREFAYDRENYVGRLDKALDEVKARGWTMVDMARDWAAVWPK